QVTTLTRNVRSRPRGHPDTMPETDSFGHTCSAETLIHMLPGVIYCARADEQWTMEYISEGCLELTGYSRDELLRNQTGNFGALIHPQDRDGVRTEVTQALQDEGRFSVEYRIRHRDGEYRWVWERGTALRWSPDDSTQRIAGHIQDASAQKEAEAAYREAERRYRTIFENAVEGIFQS